MKILIGLVVLSVISGPTQGQPRAEAKPGTAFFVAGEGSVACGTYVANRAKRHEGQDYAYYTWVRGYVSGRNHAAKKAHVGNLEEAVVLAYLDKYCRDNPLQPVIMGAIKLYEEVGGERVEVVHR